MYSSNILLPFNNKDTKSFFTSQSTSRKRPSIPTLSSLPLPKSSSNLITHAKTSNLKTNDVPIGSEKLSIRVSDDVLVDESAMTSAKHVIPSHGMGDLKAMNIQSIWSAFARFNDQDRNDLLKGILAHCDSLQIECICQELNLKLSSVNGSGPLHVHPVTSHAKINRTAFNRSQLPISTLNPYVDDTMPLSSSSSPPTKPISSKVAESSSNVLPTLSPPPPPPSSSASKKDLLFPISNANMYLKLFSPSDLQTKPTSCSKETLVKLHQFALHRSQKLEKTIEAINSAASSVNLEHAVLALMQRLQELLHAQYYTLYLCSGNPLHPSMVEVACSNWLPSGHKVSSFESLFGNAVLMKGECLNVFHANASEYFTNACHEFYPDHCTCFLSVPILSESGTLLALIEFMNKEVSSEMHLAPFFDVEDEFVLLATLPTWGLLLKEAKAEQHIRDNGAMLREVLQRLEEMKNAKTEMELQSLMETCLSRLLSAEKASLVFNLNSIDLPFEVKAKLNQGESYYVAHALTLPSFKSIGVRNLIAIPLKLNISHSNYGAIYAINKLPENEYFTQEDMLNLTKITPLLTSILSNFIEQQHTLNETKNLKANLTYLENSFFSQDQIILCCNLNLDLARVDLGGTIFQTLATSSIPIYLPLHIPRCNEVFYYDLEDCIKNHTTKFNSEYPLQYGNETQIVEYTMSFSYDQIIIWIRPCSSNLRMSRFRSTYYTESLSIQFLNYPKTSSHHSLTLLLINIDSFRKWVNSIQVELLNSFLQGFYAEIQSVTRKFSGVITSIQSDRVLCAFGLPSPAADDAERAIEAATSMLGSLKSFLASFHSNNDLKGQNLVARVVLTTGMVASSFCEFGNRSHYALVGDAVNWISNLEKVACNYGSSLLLHESTEKAAKRKYEFREIDLVSIPNSPGLSYVYDVVGLVNAIADNDIRTCVICYELGLGEYRQRNFDAALTYFRKCKSLVDDGPSSLMIKRCQKACDNIQLVPFDWDGVWKWD